MNQFYTRLGIARRQAELLGNPAELCTKIGEIQSAYEDGTSGVDQLIELLIRYARLERVVGPVNWLLGVRREDEEELRNTMELARLTHVALINMDVPITSRIIQYYRACQDDRWVGWWLVNTLSLRLEPESRGFLQEVAEIYSEADGALRRMGQELD